MSAIAKLLSRITWFWMLWLMRRPWMKYAQTVPIRYLPETLRAKAWSSHKSQNRLARRIGLPMLNVVYTLFISVLILAAFVRIAVELNERGLLTAPSELKERAGISDEP